MFNVLFVICFMPVVCAQEPPKVPQGWASSQVPALPAMKGKLEGLCGSQGMETSWWTTEPQGRGRHSGGLPPRPCPSAGWGSLQDPRWAQQPLESDWGITGALGCDCRHHLWESPAISRQGVTAECLGLPLLCPCSEPGL